MWFRAVSGAFFFLGLVGGRPAYADSELAFRNFSSPSVVRVFLKNRTRMGRITKPADRKLNGLPSSQRAVPSLSELYLVSGLSSLAVSNEGKLYELFPGSVRNGQLDVPPSLAIRQLVLVDSRGQITAGAASRFLPTTTQEVFLFNALALSAVRRKF